MTVSTATIQQSLAEKQYLTTGDAAQITGMTIQKIRTLCKQGKIPCINTSTSTRPWLMIRRCDLEAFLTPQAVVKAEKKVATRRRIDSHVPKVFG